MNGLNIEIFSLPYVVPGLNGSDGLIREHWTKGRKRKKNILLDILAQKKRKSVAKQKCLIIFVTYRTRLMDWDNCVASFKYIGDALKTANIIIDDAPKVIQYLFPIQKKVQSSKEERTEIHVVEHEGKNIQVIRHILNLINN